jgi:hypothetical protein
MSVTYNVVVPILGKSNRIFCSEKGASRRALSLTKRMHLRLVKCYLEKAGVKVVSSHPEVKE